jgi:hypothetical protein
MTSSVLITSALTSATGMLRPELSSELNFYTPLAANDTKRLGDHTDSSDREC